MSSPIPAMIEHGESAFDPQLSPPTVTASRSGTTSSITTMIGVTWVAWRRCSAVCSLSERARDAGNGRDDRHQRQGRP